MAAALQLVLKKYYKCICLDQQPCVSRCSVKQKTDSVVFFVNVLSMLVTHSSAGPTAVYCVCICGHECTDCYDSGFSLADVFFLSLSEWEGVFCIPTVGVGRFSLLATTGPYSVLISLLFPWTFPFSSFNLVFLPTQFWGYMKISAAFKPMRNFESWLCKE